MLKKEKAIKNITLLSSYILVFWGFYRFIVRLPVEVEELFIKPLFWLLPVYLLVKKEKVGLSSLGITSKNIFPSIYLSISLGILLAIGGILVNLIKYSNFEFSANVGEGIFLYSFAISFVTAITEEITFRGYLFNRLLNTTNKEWVSNLIISTLWALVHVPISVFWWKFDPSVTVVYLSLMFLYSLGAGFVFARTKNIFSSILLHVLWGWPIILFR